jgi:non-heme chloroperoxidase
MIAIQEAQTANRHDTQTIIDVKSVALSTGVRLPYVEQGDPTGVPVLLLHGLTDSWRSFEPVLPFLPESVHAFALTQRGHGDADRPAAGYHPHDFAADVAAFLDSQDVESVVIAGTSLGSTIALSFALDYPERTDGLVLLGPFAGYQSNASVVGFYEQVVMHLTDPIDQSIAREFQESTLAQPISPAFLEVVIAESLKVPARIWQAACAGLLEDAHVTGLGGIEAPTLLLWGDQDAFVSRADQDFLLGAIAGSRLEVYRNAGHAIHWEEPARFAADLTAFVEGLAG